MEKLIYAAYFSDSILKKRAHFHDCHQILLITKGEAEICVNEETYRAGAGSIVMFSRYEDHSITILSPEYERYVLQIDPLADLRGNRLFALLSNRPDGFRNILDVADRLGVFEAAFRSITEEFAAREKLADEMLGLLVQQLLIMIYRYIPDALDLEEEQAGIIYEIQRRFENRCAEPYTLESLAREYNISPSTLSHQFKRINGSSVMGYLLSCRLALAKKELAETEHSISAIIEHCGFSDSSNFSRTFRKLTGVTPSAFRAQFR